MNSLQTTQTNLPTEPAEIAQYILFTNEQVTALRQKLKLVKKLKLANDVQHETERELRELQKVNLDAKVLIGTLFNALPKETGGGFRGNRYTGGVEPTFSKKPDTGLFTKNNSDTGDSHQNTGVDGFKNASPKSETAFKKPNDDLFENDADLIDSDPNTDDQKTNYQNIDDQEIKIHVISDDVKPVEPKTPSRPMNRKELAESLGFSHTEVKRFQQLAKHPEAVEQAKALAGTKDPETGKVFEPTASNVISLIQAREIKEDKEYTRSIDALTGLSKLHGTLEKLLALPEDEDLIKAMVYECDKDDLIMACDSIRTGLQRLQKILSVFSREVVKT